jgi:ADP-ribosylglycohydrolase
MSDPFARAKLALDGLSVGDAFGECFLRQIASPLRVASREMPPAPWTHTDDTEMAVCIVEVLQRHGRIDQDDLARTFARRFMNDPERGYGGGARRILVSIYAGEPWYMASGSAFGGTGSMGNGSAMRVAPLGAWFADDPQRVIEQAALSAEVTHMNDEGRAGAIAVALATAFAANHVGKSTPRLLREFFDFIIEQTPDSRTLEGIEQAVDLPRSSSVREAAALLGNGIQVTCPDTVPLCIWLAARHWDNYPEAMWNTVTASGDIDTNCAIVGGIVAMSAHEHRIPAEWIRARGPLRATQWPEE